MKYNENVSKCTTNFKTYNLLLCIYFIKNSKDSEALASPLVTNVSNS